MKLHAIKIKMSSYHIAFTFFSLCVFYSCHPIYYIPNSHNVPLISEKKEANISLMGDPDRVELQAAYGLTESFAIQANTALYIPKDDENGSGGSGNLFEVGAGYFTKVATQGHVSAVFEVYGLMGYGSVENHFPSDDPQNNSFDNISANFWRIGIQPNFGLKSKYLSIAISTRLVNLRYNNIKGNLVHENIIQTDYLNDNRSLFLVEPALTLRVGLKKFKIHGQLGASQNLTNTQFHQYDLYYTLGLNYNIY